MNPKYWNPRIYNLTFGAKIDFYEIGNNFTTPKCCPQNGSHAIIASSAFSFFSCYWQNVPLSSLIFEVKFSFPLFFSTKYQSRQKILKWLIREAPDHLKLIGRIRHRHCKLQIWLELCWRKKKNQIISKVHILSKNSIFSDFLKIVFNWTKVN